MGGRAALDQRQVGLNGISYYGINQWHVASLQPPHLAAMCIWEGAADWYRDMTHHGGILCTFWANWYDMQVKTVQYGARRARASAAACTANSSAARRPFRKRNSRANRSDFGDEILAHPLDDDYHRARSPDLVEGQGAVPVGRQLGRPGPAPARQFRRLLSGRVQSRNGSKRTASSTGRISTPIMAASCSCASSTHFLHGKKNGWDKQPRVQLQVRHVDRFVERPRMNGRSSAPNGPNSTSIRQCVPRRGSAGQRGDQDFDAMGDGVTFLTAPLPQRPRSPGRRR